jgi:hypothetical protein
VRDSIEYVLPARRLSGSRAEVLAEIDELIQGLLGLRQLVERRGRRPNAAIDRRLRLVPRSAVAPVVVCCVLLGASPAAGQTPDPPPAPAVAAGEATDPNPGALTLAGADHTFGYVSVAGILTVPLGSSGRFGAWNGVLLPFAGLKAIDVLLVAMGLA